MAIGAVRNGNYNHGRNARTSERTLRHGRCLLKDSGEKVLKGLGIGAQYREETKYTPGLISANT